MHLSSFGLISLNGSVTKPEPGLGFADYQAAMANYSATLALRSRVREPVRYEVEPQPKQAEKLAPAPAVRRQSGDDELVRKRPRVDAASLVRRFRA